MTKQQRITLIILMAGALLSILNQTLLNPMLPSIMRDTGVDATTAQWLASGFILVNAIVIAITAFLMDRFTTRQLFIVCFVLFLAGSLLGGWGINFPVLLIGRLLQAVCAGVMIPMTMTTLLLLYPPDRRGSAMGMFSFVIMFAPAVGPVLSGIMTDQIGWRMLFFLMAALSVLVIIAAAIFLKNIGERKKVTLDKSSLLLSSFGLLFLLYGFSLLGHFETLAMGIVLSLTGALILFFFARRQLKMPVPFLELSVLKNKRFLIGTIVLMILQASLASLSLTIPLYIQSVRGMSATISGMVMMPGALLGAITGYYSGRLYDRFGPQVVSITGVSILAVGSLLCALFDMESSVVFITVSFTIRSVGLMISNTPLNTWAVSTLDDEVLHHGNAISNTLRQIASTLCIAIMISIMTLVTTLSPSDDPVQAEFIGISATFWASLAIVLVALVIVIVKVRGKNAYKLPVNVEDADFKLSAVMKSIPYTIGEDDSLEKVVKSFIENHTSGLPVVAKSGHIIGFISDGDVMRFMEKHDVSLAAENISVVLPDNESFSSKASALMNKNVMEIATRHVITAPHDASLQDICELFAERHLHKLPVTQDGVLIGTISRGDVMRVLFQRLDYQTFPPPIP